MLNFIENNDNLDCYLDKTLVAKISKYGLLSYINNDIILSDEDINEIKFKSIIINRNINKKCLSENDQKNFEINEFGQCIIKK